MPIDRRGDGADRLARRREGREGRRARLGRGRRSSGRFGLPSARIVERLGDVSSEKAISLIALEEHGIPHVFPHAVLDGRGGGRARRHGASRGLDASCRSSRSTRPTPATTTMPSMPSPIRRTRAAFVVTVAIADVAYYVRPGSELDREAREARQFGLFPRPRRADAAGAHLQRPLLAARRRAAPCPRRADALQRRGQEARPQLPSRDDALGGKALLRAGAGGDRRPPRRQDQAACSSRS